MDLAFGIFIPQSAASDRPASLLVSGSAQPERRFPSLRGLRAVLALVEGACSWRQPVPHFAGTCARCSASRDDADGSEQDRCRPRPAEREAATRGLGRAEERIDEVGACWPVADDVELAAVDLDGVPGEWSIVPGNDASRVLLFFHGGGYCSGPSAAIAGW